MSSVFQVDNIKNEPMRFPIFPLHLSKVLRLPPKSDARSYEVLHLSRKITPANLKIWCSKMQPIPGNQRPNLLTSLMNMSLVLRLPREMHFCRSSANLPRLPSFLDMPQNPHVLLTFSTVQNPLRLPRETTSEPSKVVRACGVFNILTWKCAVPQRRACTFSTCQLPKVVRARCALYNLTWKRASRHNGVHFFNISTSKSGPNPTVFALLTSRCASRHNGVHFLDISTSKSASKLVCFVHFDLEVCVQPQKVVRTWCALYALKGCAFNVKKWSEPGVLCAFWLGNVLRARTASTFSSSQPQKVVRTWCVLYILTWKRASRHNGVQFLISHLASWLRTRPFSEPTFRPSGATNHWKNTVFRDFATFSRTWIFFLLRLPLFFLSSSLLFSDSSHLCFSSVHIVGNLTSKLHSIRYIYIYLFIYLYLYLYLYLYIIYIIYINIYNFYIYNMKTMRFSSIFPIFPSRNLREPGRATVRALLRFQVLALAHQNTALVGSTDHLRPVTALGSSHWNGEGKIVVFRLVIFRCYETHDYSFVIYLCTFIINYYTII